MSLVSDQLTLLVKRTDDLLEAINVPKAVLDQRVIDATAAAVTAVDKAVLTALDAAATAQDRTVSGLSAASALASKVLTDRLYPGSFATDPVLRPDGTARQMGDEMFNSTVGLKKRWSGSVWQASDISTANLAAAGGSGLVGYSNGGSPITVEQQMDILHYGITNVRNTKFAGGALGGNSQTLFATNYATDIAVSAITITQQTQDGLAINAAIRELRAVGQGVLYIPAGNYRVYGYLERINFPCRIIGAGEGNTTVKNCDASPTNVNGYGIFIVEPYVQATVTFENLTLDGNAAVRAQPTGEFRSYPLAWYGKVNAKIVNVTSKNSPIDCMITAYANDNLSSLQAVNLTLSNSYRNTLSLVSGWNQHYTNCLVEKGGRVYTGTNPKYCLDIEPNLATNTIKNIAFTNTTFREAVNVVMGGIWAGNVQFNNCTAEATGTEWVFNFRGGEFTFNGGRLLGNPVTCDSFIRLTNPVTTGEYVKTEFVRLNGVQMDGCGIQGYGLNMYFDNVVLRNAKRPVIFGGADAEKQLFINNMKLINVIDASNYGSGSYSSFVIRSDFGGAVDITGLIVRVDASQLPTQPLFTAATAVYGIYISTTPSDVERKISNVHVAGYYRKYPTALGYSLSPSTYRDWNIPALPPADTAGQTAGPGTACYRNCTAYGDFA